MPTIVGGFQRPAYRLGTTPHPALAASAAAGLRTGRAVGAESPPRRTRQVFVAYPYGMFDRADYRGVFTGLGRAYDVRFIFADERITNLQVVEKIRGDIRRSDFALFDVSGWNANVAFELGMAYEMSGVDWYICFNPDKNGRAEVPSNIRGLDRIEYRGFAELRDKLIPLMEQWYPPDARETPDEFAEKMKAKIIALLRAHPDGLPIREIARRAQINQEMASVAVRQLKEGGKVNQAGKSSAARYRLKKTNGSAV